MTRTADITITTAPEAKLAGETWPQCAVRMAAGLRRGVRLPAHQTSEPFAEVYEYVPGGFTQHEPRTERTHDDDGQQ